MLYRRLSVLCSIGDKGAGQVSYTIVFPSRHSISPTVLLWWSSRIDLCSLLTKVKELQCTSPGRHWPFNDLIWKIFLLTQLKLDVNKLPDSAVGLESEISSDQILMITKQYF